MPTPVSLMQKVRQNSPFSEGRPATERSTSPSSVNFTALLSRFTRICRMRVASPIHQLCSFSSIR